MWKSHSNGWLIHWELSEMTVPKTTNDPFTNTYYRSKENRPRAKSSEK